MGTPQKMSKIRIITPRSHSSTVINTLYELSLLHIQEYNGTIKIEENTLDNGTSLENADNISKALLTVRTLKNTLQIKGKSKSPDFNVKKAVERLQTLSEQVTTLYNEEKAKEKELEKVEQMYSILNALRECGVEIDLLPKLRRVAAFVGMVNDPVQIKEKIKDVKNEIKTSPFNGGHIAVLFVQKKDHDKTKDLIIETGFTPLDLAEYRTITYEECEKQKEQCTNEVKKIKTKIKEIRENSELFLKKCEPALEEEVKKCEIPLQFATTKKSLIATGFVPTKQLTELKNKLNNITKNNIIIEDLHIHHDEKVPIKLKNSKNIKNFEVLTKLYELPNYFEFDPSSLIFLTFPLFFGIMLGDVGYGLITLLLFTILKKKFPQAKSWFNVLIYASIITILFGAVFGEYLGFEHVSMETGQALCENIGLCLHKEIISHHGVSTIVYDFPRLMNRVHDTIIVGGFELLSILAIGIGIGFFHLNFGLLVGFFNIWRAHGLRLAFLEKISWFIMEAGLGIALLSYLNIITTPLWLGAGIAIAAVVLLYLGEGAKGVVEIPALFSNMLSYMRLGAVGLASVGLAVVVNENLALPLLTKGGIINIVIGTIVMVIGHTVNIGLGVIGPFLHGIRLHYVEFFSKFFHGGGKEYTPFGKKAQMGGE